MGTRRKQRGRFGGHAKGDEAGQGFELTPGVMGSATRRARAPATKDPSLTTEQTLRVTADGMGYSGTNGGREKEGTTRGKNDSRT